MDNYRCELCRRVGITKITEHHLTPKERGGKNMPTAWLCEDCHKQIHALYTNKELSVRLDSIEKLENDEKIKKYLNYVRKQSPTKKISIRKSREARIKR